MLGANGLKAMLLYWCMRWEHMRWCMPNFDVAWARRFSCGNRQEYFSLPANVHPASYLDFIYSWLNKVDPTRSQCALHVISRVVLRREGKCFFEIYCSYLYARSNFDEYSRYFVLKRTKVYGVPHSMRQQQFVRCTCYYPRRIPISALIRWSTTTQNTITNTVTLHRMQFNVRILTSFECSRAPTCVLHFVE